MKMGEEIKNAFEVNVDAKRIYYILNKQENPKYYEVAEVLDSVHNRENIPLLFLNRLISSLKFVDSEGFYIFNDINLGDKGLVRYKLNLCIDVIEDDIIEVNVDRFVSGDFNDNLIKYDKTWVFWCNGLKRYNMGPEYNDMLENLLSV